MMLTMFSYSTRFFSFIFLQYNRLDQTAMSCEDTKISREDEVTKETYKNKKNKTMAAPKKSPDPVRRDGQKVTNAKYGDMNESERMKSEKRRTAGKKDWDDLRCYVFRCYVFRCYDLETCNCLQSRRRKQNFISLYLTYPTEKEPWITSSDFMATLHT